MPKTISAGELKKKLDQGASIKIIDTLSADSYDKCHIPGAINIPLNELSSQAPDKLNKKDEIVVYCGSYECTRSTQAFETLQKMGFKNVWEFEGGLKEWQEKKFPCQGGANPEAVRAQFKKAA